MGCVTLDGPRHGETSWRFAILSVFKMPNQAFKHYVCLAKRLGLKALETVTFFTTRFTSLSYEQWEKIYSSYKALITAFLEIRENDEDDCEEAKYQVRGQDYAIDLCGILDVMKQASYGWVKPSRYHIGRLFRGSQLLYACSKWLELIWENCDLEGGRFLTKKFCRNFISKSIEDNATFQDIELLDGWLVVNQKTAVVLPVAGQVHGRRETVY